MSKSILEHQRELIALQKKAIKELQENIINAKYGTDSKDKILEDLDDIAEKVVVRADKKKALINHYYGEAII